MRITLTPDGRELVHHSRCGGVPGVHPLRVHPDGSSCACPVSWPRLRCDALINHRWNGNCLRGDLRQLQRTPQPLCVLHGEPRGSCRRCVPCGGCEAGKRAQEAMTNPRPPCSCGHTSGQHATYNTRCLECPCRFYAPWPAEVDHARPLNR